jgi:hypothetical protein
MADVIPLYEMYFANVFNWSVREPEFNEITIMDGVDILLKITDLRQAQFVHALKDFE